jgi:phage tail sheath protein FI
MPTYLTPGLYFETVDAESEPVPPARVDITGFAGVTARGPIDTPVRITSQSQFQATFGGPIRNGLLAYAVKAFLDNGGQVCHIVRVAAPELPLALTGTQPADRRSSVLSDVRGLADGVVVTFRQKTVIHNYLVTGINVGTNTVTWDRQLDADLVLTNPLTLASGSGTASATVPDDSPAPAPDCLVLSAASPGRWGNAVRVGVSQTSGAATATDRAKTQPAGRDASFVTAVTGFTPGTLVRVGQTGQPTVRRLVTATDPVGRRISWDAALPTGLSLTAPIRFEVESFALAILEGGTTREVFSGLSLTSAHARFVETVLAAESNELRAEVLPGTPYRLPAAAGVVLGGGRDGTAALTVTDLTGDPSDPRPGGLLALEPVAEVALVAAPDLVAEPTEPLVLAPLPPPSYDPCLDAPPIDLPVPRDPELIERSASFGIEQIYLAQLRLVDSCERLADRVALLDPPRFRTADTPLHIDALREWRARFDSSYAALHAPWVDVIDPLPSIDVLRPLPPSGHVAGVIARVDADRGPAQAPANEELTWAYSLDGDIDAATHGLLNPEGISVLRRFDGRGLRVYGARTVSSQPLLQLLNVRRLLISIRRALDSAMQWAVFEPANLATRQLITTSIRSYLLALYDEGAFSGATPEEAFFVRCDEELNPPEQAALGILVAEIGVAPVRPAEFVVLRIGRTENGLDFADPGRPSGLTGVS